MHLEQKILNSLRKKLSKKKIIKGVILDSYFIDDNGKWHPIKGKEKIAKIPEEGEEFEMAIWIKENLGGDIHIVPRIETEKGNKDYVTVKTPDYIWNNEKWDLKTPRIGGKTIIYRYVKKPGQKIQATNLIINVSHLEEKNKYIINLLKYQLKKPHNKWIQKVLIIRNEKIIYFIKI